MKTSAVAFIAVLLFAVIAVAQKNEHYNSPLYSPRKYDPSVGTANGIPEPLKKVGIEQKLGAKLPLESVFKDEDGNAVRLGDLFSSGRPVILTFVYFECPMLCNQVLNGLTGSLKGVSLNAGKDFDVIALSFDSSENNKSGLAKNKKASYMERYGRPGTESGWHFLTGDEGAIKAVTETAGFSFEWDERSEQFAHASAIIIVTPDGAISRYLYGIDYAPRDVRLGLVESAENKIGNVADQLLLYCYHYDPSTGKYGFAILSVLRGAAVLTLFGMGLMGFVFWRRSKGRRSDPDGPDSTGN
ncbi:SCO family protein [Leptolyngbya sp. 7M]|uniref:SCO family protein n=1 Tax=Leptolyngbya sp. 7M TaxID=2812896 RepID=UPI001B8ACF15|nr:SCO family protein [Leptolyngbya sp. 7M]QYO65753.1 SCO family protein [Leptolyngbya sp. 7M]